MRVLVACDSLAGLTPRDASQIIGQAFADAGAQVAVVPLADGGDWLASALAEIDPSAEYRRARGLDELLSALESPGSGRLVVDLVGASAPAIAHLSDAASAERIAALRAQLDGREVLGVVSRADEAMALTGLSGALPERGRRDGVDLAVTLSDDAAGSRWAESLGLDGASPGTGAVVGLGAVVLAAGGELTTGIDLCADGFRLRDVLPKADVVVTGAAQLDFHAVGGDVVREVARLAGEALRPVVAVVGRNFVSSRELRLAGIEAAYPVLTGAGEDEPSPEQLAHTARQVAATWRW